MGRAGANLHLPYSHVVPFSVFVADALIDADGPESHRLVECDAGGIGQGYAGDGSAVTLRRQTAEKEVYRARPIPRR